MEEGRDLYSPEVHKMVVLINTFVIGFLGLSNLEAVETNAVTPTTFALFKTHQATFLSYWVLIIIYASLRILEKIKVSNIWFSKLVGHTSHLVGALAAIVLISVVSNIYSLIVVPLWLAWLFTVFFNVFQELTHPRESSSGGGVEQPNQLVPV